MKSFQRTKIIHGRPYLYRITPYYDRESKQIRQRSEYIGQLKDGKLVETTAMTYSYGDLIPIMNAVHDLNLHEILGRIAGEHRDALMVMAVNHVIRPVSMDLIEEWYEDSYISTLYRADTSSSTLSRLLSVIGSMNPNHSFLKEIVNFTGKSGALYYDLTSYSSQSRNIEFLEYGYF